MSEQKKSHDPAFGAASGDGWRSAALLVGLLVAVYMVSQFIRNSIGVIGPDLAREFDLDANALSLLSSIFFLSFALVQIPLGIAIDGYGPKASMLATAAIMVGGLALFAVAPDYRWLLAARIVLGLGCSSFLMAPLAIYSARFPPQQFATMVGVQIGGGNLGTLLSTAPLAVASAAIGWRGSFLVIAAAAALVSVAVMFLVDDRRSREALAGRPRETPTELLLGVREATRVPFFWPIFLMQAVSYSSFAAVLGLWGGPWLTHVYGYDLAGRGNLLFWMSLSQIVGLFAWGVSDRLFGSYRIPAMIGGAAAIGLLGLAALVGISVPFLLPFLLAYGFAFATTPLLTAQGRSLFPPRLLGRGLTLINIGSMGGVFAQQALTGLVIGLFEPMIVDGARIYPEIAYRAVFALLGVEMVLAMGAYAFFGRRFLENK